MAARSFRDRERFARLALLLFVVMSFAGLVNFWNKTHLAVLFIHTHCKWFDDISCLFKLWFSEGSVDSGILSKTNFSCTFYNSIVQNIRLGITLNCGYMYKAYIKYITTTSIFMHILFIWSMFSLTNMYTNHVITWLINSILWFFFFVAFSNAK